MNLYLPGIGLMVAGVVIFFLGRTRSKRVSVQADGGSVAVGGDNNGQIINTNMNQQKKEHSAGGHGLTILAILVELAGISVTVWHALHLGVK